MFGSVEAVKKYCADNNIKMIDFKMIDLLGRWRHLTLPADRFGEQILKRGIGFDGSNYGFAPVEKSDMVFIPDITTGFPEPFSDTKTLSMIGDVFVIRDTPVLFGQDPRAVAKRCEEYMDKTGIADEMRTGPEFEFYIFDHISYENKPHRSGFSIDSQQAEWNNAKDENNLGFKVPLKGGYHITPPMDVLYDLRSQMCMLLEELGIKVKYHHHEVGGPGQMEIEVESGPMRKMADATMLMKYIIKNAAFSAGKSATFMPKPLLGEAGSGLHVHMHLFKNGAPLFYDENGYSGFSKTGLYFIGGILKHIKALCALTNPSTNSYKRLVEGYEAPVNVCFSTGNRSAVIRIPDYARDPEEKRFELRSPDATCNPYYAYSALLMAGLDGIENEIDPVSAGYGPYDVNIYNLPDEEKKKIGILPRTLDEALNALEEDNEFLLKGEVFSTRLLEIWINKKREETMIYNRTPQPTEFTMYYDL